jgi:putative protease
MAKENLIGEVFVYFAKVEVAALNLVGDLKVGDKIHFKGNTTDFTQTIKSMQIQHNSIKEVKAGDDVGLKVDNRVRPKDKIYKVL